MKNFQRRLDLLYSIKRFATFAYHYDTIRRVDTVIDHTRRLINSAKLKIV